MGEFKEGGRNKLVIIMRGLDLLTLACEFSKRLKVNTRISKLNYIIFFYSFFLKLLTLFKTLAKN